MTMEPRANIEYLERICRLKDARIKELEARVAELETALQAMRAAVIRGVAGGYPPSGAYFENGKAMFGGRGGGGQG